MRESPTVLLFIFITFFVLNCNTRTEQTASEGYLPVNGGKIWFKVVGGGDKLPLVLLHGGPGYPSYYLNSMLALSKDRPVIIFDQLGCGRSDRISDTTLMTIDNHIDQLRQLLTHLEVKEFYLYGHSWGSMLAMDYYLKYPAGIQAMILASPCLSAHLWLADADTLISTLPDTTQVVLRQSMQNIVEDSAKLTAAYNLYYDNFYARKLPLSADCDSANAQFGVNIYEYMWGNSEFHATGTLKNYDRTKELSKVKVPTLYTTGEF